MRQRKWAGLGSLLLALLFCGQSFAQIDLPAEIAPYKAIVATWTNDAPTGAESRVKWSCDPATELIKVDDNTAHCWAPPGEHFVAVTGMWVQFEIVEVSGKQIKSVVGWDQINQKKAFKVTGKAPPIPPDPIPPDPVPPDPPDPNPGPLPIEGEGLRVLILEETRDRATLPRGQLLALQSAEVDTYLRTHCVKEDNVPGFRVWDDDYTTDQLSGMAENWRKAYQRALTDSGGTRPWILIANGKTGTSQAFPADTAKLLELLAEYATTSTATVKDLEHCLDVAQQKAESINARLAQTKRLFKDAGKRYAQDQPRRNKTMPFTSTIPPNAIVIDDSNWRNFVQNPVLDGEVKGRGRLPIPADSMLMQGFGALGIARIPREQWIERIEEAEKNGTSLLAQIRAAGLKCKDQNSTNYCWINAPTHCIEIQRMVQGEKMVTLSPASAGAPIKNFRNNGGWGTEGLRWIAEKGLVPVEQWPANAIQSKYYTDENKQLALKYRATDWVQLGHRSLDDLFTCCFSGIPVACGYPWWSHEVTGLVPLYFGGDLNSVNSWGLGIHNSWGESYGDKGYGVLKGSKAVPDDACVAFAVLPGG